MDEHTQRATGPELRYAVTALTGVDFRDATATPDGSWTISGYAAVFDQTATLYDGKFLRVEERIQRGAFTNVLSRITLPPTDPSRTLVHLNLGHDMNSAVAATDVDGIGGLTLDERDAGLFYLARVDRADPDATRMAAKLSRGVIRQASFAFRVNRDEVVTTTDENGKEHDVRTIIEVGELYDVSVCAQGAYSQTVSQLRSYAAALGHAPPGAGQPHHDEPALVLSGASDVNPSGGGRGDHPNLQALQADVRRRAHIAMNGAMR